MKGLLEALRQVNESGVKTAFILVRNEDLSIHPTPNFEDFQTAVAMFDMEYAKRLALDEIQDLIAQSMGDDYHDYGYEEEGEEIQAPVSDRDAWKEYVEISETHTLWRAHVSGIGSWHGFAIDFYT